jgi:hypothetical protein
MKHKLLASKFIEWYYSDHDDIEYLGKSMLRLMKTTGQCSLSAREVFECCEYIPKHICEDNDGIDQYTTDYDTEQVELINDFKTAL